MKKKTVIFFATMAAALAAGAQEPWSMERCMAYAAEQAPAVKRARWELLGSQAELAASTAGFFPSLSASTSAQFSWGRNIDPETNSYNDVTTFSNGYGLYASLTLFDGGQTLNRWRLARVERERSRNSVEMRREDCAIATMMAYIDVVYYKNATGIAQEKVSRSEELLRLTALQEELGTKAQPDVARAEAALAEDRYNLLCQQNLARQAMLTLKSSMNYPADEPLLTDTLPALPLPPAQCDDPDALYAAALSFHPAAREAEMSVRASKLRYNRSRGALWPTLQMSAGISTSYYKTLGDSYSYPSFSEQFKNHRGEYVSFSLSIPLFDNLSRSSSLRQYRYSYKSAIEQRDEQLRSLHDGIERAVMERDGYALEVRALDSKTKADSIVCHLDRRKYQEGLLPLVDLQLSANNYYASRVSLLQKQMLYILKEKLVNYYKGETLWTLK